MTRFRRFWMIIAPAAAVHLSAGNAWAQKIGRVPETETDWTMWAIAAGLGILICVMGLINVRRSHR